MTSHDGGGGGGGFWDRLDHWLEQRERDFLDWLERVWDSLRGENEPTSAWSA